MLKVVHCEGPIYYEEAWRRVIQHWGMKTLGVRMRKILKELEKFCITNKKINKKKNFYWLVEEQELKVRDRNIEGYNKKIEFVAPEEIQKAILYVLEIDFRVPKESLIVQTAKLLGFHRLGHDVYASVEKNRR